MGEIVSTKLQRISKFTGVLLAAGFLFSSGCGSGTTNVITVNISSSVGNTLIVGQSTTLTATATGATNTNITWLPGLPANVNCTYTVTTVNAAGTSSTTTNPPLNCPADNSFGTLTNKQITGTATYTAPSSIPDPTKYPSLAIIITAASQQDSSKTGKITLFLNSGVSVVLTPTTATVPTGELEQFSVSITNDLASKGVNWLLTQQVPTATVSYPQLKTCSPTCGTIAPTTPNGPVALYTAPAVVPTSITPADATNTNSPAILTLVASSVTDNTRLALGTITIIAGGQITFRGISPTIAPQGAYYWDLYLDAPNFSSLSNITITDSVGGTKKILSGSGQIKVLFPIPITTTVNNVTTVTNPNSTGGRLRLSSNELASAGTFTIIITDPGTQPVLTPNPASSYTFTVVPVRPTSIASVPNDVVQGNQAQDTRVIIDGGYFGPTGGLAQIQFQGNAVTQDGLHPSSARQLDALLSTNQIKAATPGLYPLSVSSTNTSLQSSVSPSVTNIAVFPDFSAISPTVVTASTGSIPAGTNPSAVDIDPTLGILAVAETSSNQVQFFSIVPPTATASATLTSIGVATSTPTAPLNFPTGLSVDRVHHTVAVVNYGSQLKDANNNPLPPTLQSVTVLPIPTAPGTAITPFSVDISGALQGSVSPAPMPYSIGVDPDSQLALVAYSSTSSSSSVNLGFVVNLNANTSGSNPYGCPLGQAISSTSNVYGQCLYSQVTLNTGVYPQIAMAPHGHLAYVTPGGGYSSARAVDVTTPSAAHSVASASLAAGLVTVTVDVNACLPGQTPPPGQTTCPLPLGLLPGNAGTVMITGMVPTNAANKALFNGVFTVTVTSSTSFTYASLNTTATDTASGITNNVQTGVVYYRGPDLVFPISSTTQGISINPVTSTVAFADANNTGLNGPQIDLLNGTDHSPSSITFHATCTFFTTACANAAEFLGTTGVACQPYTNALVSYNPTLNQVSISDPVSAQRYAFACLTSSTCRGTITDLTQIVLPGTGTATLNANSVPPLHNATTDSLTLFGGIAVDPVTNQAFVVKSGSGTIDIVDLGSAYLNNPIKTAQIDELIVPSAPPIGCPQPTPGNPIVSGIPNASLLQGTLTSTTDLCGVQIFGSGFLAGASGSTQVRLDGISVPPANVTVDPSGRKLTVTIPQSFLIAPHKYSLDLITNDSQTGLTAQSNSADFYVIQAIDMSKICFDASNNPVNTMPTSVVIGDQIANGPFSPFALVSNTGCNSVSLIDINPANATFGHLIGNPIPVGLAPEGMAISQRYGLAVVANNGAGTASVVDLTTNPPGPKVPDVPTGTNPTGVGINDATGSAIVTNTGSNTITELNLGLLFPASGTTPPSTLTPISIGGVQEPIAVAIDPDRGTYNEGIAVVTSLQLVSGQAPQGALAVIEIGLQTPSLSSTISSGFVTATPTGIVFDPSVTTGTANNGLFYANSSGANVITSFNPDTGGGGSVSVGINPTSLALNPQTGALLTANSASNTVSVVNTLSSPFKTITTLGLPGSPTFGVAIDQFTNLAVIVDQAHLRVLLFPMPN